MAGSVFEPSGLNGYDEVEYSLKAALKQNSLIRIREMKSCSDVVRVMKRKSTVRRRQTLKRSVCEATNHTHVRALSKFASPLPDAFHRKLSPA